jgi:ElaB/YqjD/DUF883 family membrane-anchored ribosome-binding protein
MSNTYSSTPPAQGFPPPSGEPTVGGRVGPSSLDQDDTRAGTGDQASHVAESAKEAGGKVFDAAKEETGKVAGEAKSQAKSLFDQTKTELVDQAGTQQQRAASGLRSLGGELGQMADSSPGGVAGELVAQAASRADAVAEWLEQRDPGSLLDEVRTFARQRPGTFIAIAAGAGLLVGRLTRSVASAGSDDTEARP